MKFNIQEMIDLSGKILDGDATKNDCNSLAEQVIDYFKEMKKLPLYENDLSDIEI